MKQEHCKRLEQKLSLDRAAGKKEQSVHSRRLKQEQSLGLGEIMSTVHYKQLKQELSLDKTRTIIFSLKY